VKAAPLLILPLTAALATEPEVPVEESRLGDDIAANLERDRAARDSRSFDFLADLDRARLDFQRRIGLDFSASYHTVGLAGVPGGGITSGASGDFTLQGAWSPGEHWREHPLQLRFRMRHRHALGGRPTSDLRNEIGTLWGLVDGFTNAGFEVPDFYFQQEFPRSDILVRYGQMTIDSQFDAHRLRGSKQSFLNQAFASNPAIAFPRFGAGLTLRKSFDNGLDITLGGSTVQGSQNDRQVDFEFGSDDIFSAIQFGYDFTLADEREARVQLVGWHSDAIEDTGTPGGEGLAFTYEQELRADGPRLFFRLAWAEGGATPVDLFSAAGIAFRCRDDGVLGFALGAGRGSDADGDLQGVFETLYRWQARDWLRLSPDLQIVFGEGFNEGPGLRLFAGLRAELVF